MPAPRTLPAKADPRRAPWAMPAALAATLVLSACGLLPPVPVFQHVNERIGELAASLVEAEATERASLDTPQVARASERPGRDALRGNTFVGLGLSGGGSRAAVFGAAVLQQLEQLGLMPQVTVLSSVSGGGLAAGWYALHGATLTADDTEAWQRMHQAMAQDFRQEWQHAVLAPHNLLATFASGINRSDLMVQVFERRLFQGATFAQLGAPGPRRPVVLFNATDITREGVGFAFSDEEFSARSSRLDSFPIARAVMASGAFPGAFSSITLRNHPPRRPDGSASTRLTYTHLMDGGPADNHGIDKLLQTARSAWQRSPDPSRFACLFIVVDAHVANHSSERAGDRDLRNSPIDFLVDPNVYEAVDTLLAQRRFDSLARLGLQLPRSQRDGRRVAGSFHFAQADGGTRRTVLHYARVVDFDLPVDGTETAGQPPRCRAWHVSLNEILTITAGLPHDASGLPDRNDPVLRQRTALWEGLTRIRTDYRLQGPAGCSTAQLQQALQQAARLALREDSDALDRVCEWTGRQLGAVAEARCRSALPGTPLAVPFRVSTEPDSRSSRVWCETAP
jgi:NTE family protein